MLYDLNKSFAHHMQHGFDFDHLPYIPSDKHMKSIFGYSVNSTIGVSACPLTTAQGIKMLAHMGYGIFTYKTIRSEASPTHPLPNISYVPMPKELSQIDLGTSYVARSEQPQDNFALANSFGNGSLEPEIMQADIAEARAALSDRQLLIVSIYGSGETQAALCRSYATAAALAQDAGAQVIECNLSCPNIPGAPPIFMDSEKIYCIVKTVAQTVQLPVSIKIGFCDHAQLKEILISAARAGAQGICAINSIPMRIINEQGNAYFGPERAVCGISGNPIRALALQTIKNMRMFIEQEKLALTVFGTGGITQPEHIDQFFQAGADIALSATGVMLDPYLAINYFLNTSELKCASLQP